MEIQRKDLIIGAIYRAEWQDNGLRRNILRFNGFQDPPSFCCKPCSFINSVDNYWKESRCCGDKTKFYNATIEEIVWLEACEKDRKTVPKPNFKQLEQTYISLIFN